MLKRNTYSLLASELVWEQSSLWVLIRTKSVHSYYNCSYRKLKVDSQIPTRKQSRRIYSAESVHRITGNKILQQTVRRIIDGEN
uniref:Uncharacterized protein n=1 Tax=Setaria italica TaxID=4555 RepID=K3XNU2_SETIT